ncbi:heavy metal sensor histidine kinase [Aquincola sp. MAHUQ-54]|uniref:Sensor protein n=1 Tax=Aquincola agrisoli TaxID=3119538 RepID=A0AAW9QE44_9BURK
MTRYLSIRLAAMFAGCAAVVFLLAGLALYQVLEEGMARQVRGEAKLRGSWVESEVARVQSESQWRLWLAPKLGAADLERNGTRLWIVSGNAAFRYGTPTPEIEALARAGGFGTLAEAGHPCLLVTWAKTVPGDGDRPEVTIVLAKDPLRFWETLAAFRLALIGFGAAGVLAVAALGLGIARVGLRPLKRLSGQAQALDPNHKHQRLALAPMPAELTDLTASFNGALQRLEAAYQQLEAFNADVAHELRTPLANLIGQTQVVLTRRRDAAELAEVLHSNLEELERLKAIVNDMLFLARVDQGAAASHPSEVSIAAEVARVVDFLDALIEERGVRVTVHGDARGCAETALLQRALGNLLGNAIEHSAAGDEITVAISRAGEHVTVAVSNPGRAIERQHLAHLFDRFYRVDTARRNSGGNHGLGLAIVKAIAAMHRGSVFVRSEQGLNTFGFTLRAPA